MASQRRAVLVAALAVCTHAPANAFFTPAQPLGHGRAGAAAGVAGHALCLTSRASFTLQLERKSLQLARTRLEMVATTATPPLPNGEEEDSSRRAIRAETGDAEAHPQGADEKAEFKVFVSYINIE